MWAATFGGDVPRYRTDAGASGDFDVAIVGAGYTGLWTALSLARAEAGIRIVVVDRACVGFGASGRNGGWCSALLPIGMAALARRHGRDRAILWQREMFHTVDEIGHFALATAGRGIDPGFHKGGTITLAHDPFQQHRIEASAAEARSFDFGDEDARLLDADDAGRHCRAGRVTGALFSPHCAAVDPLRLAHAVAAAAETAGVRIAEGVDVVEIVPGRVTTTEGSIRAGVVVLATEAYTATLPGRRRDVLPLYSMMIGSEPLTAAQWGEIGLADRPTFASATNMVIYGQRTHDGRLAFGGRGAPYHFGSRIADRFDTDRRVRTMLRDTVMRIFPVLADVEFPFHWGGPLGVPRDWHPHVAFDTTTGLASAGGYAGDGVAMANLAGRTLADLILRRDTDITRLPWVGHRSRRWEPEPLRWLGVRLGAFAASRADAAESSTAPLADRRAGAWGKLLATLSDGGRGRRSTRDGGR